MKGDTNWHEHELRTLAVQKRMVDKTIDRLIAKIGDIKRGGGTVDRHTRDALKQSASDSTYLKRKMVEIRKILKEGRK